MNMLKFNEYPDVYEYDNVYEYANKYPQYGFEKHKGYGTKLHIDAIKEYGPCEIHRMSFLKKILK